MIWRVSREVHRETALGEGEKERSVGSVLDFAVMVRAEGDSHVGLT